MTTKSPSTTAPLLAALVFLVALNLRPAIVAVGPLLSSIGDALGWEETLQGLLGTLPLLAFALFSPLVRLVTERFDADRVVFVALVVLAAGCVVRSLFGVTGIWIGTVAIGGAIAVGNVLVPAIVKRDYIDHVSTATGVYSACITSGSAIAGLSSSALAGALGGWQEALAFWAAPALVVAALWSLRLRRGKSTASKLPKRSACQHEGQRSSDADAVFAASLKTTPADVHLSRADHGAAASRSSRNEAVGTRAARPACATNSIAAAAPIDAKTTDAETATINENGTAITANRTNPKPLWRRPVTWLVTLMMGLQSASFYTLSNWLPTIAQTNGFTATEAGMQLFLFQAIGILSGLAIPRLMYVRGNQVCAGLAASVSMVIAVLGWLFAPQASWAWSVIGGVGQGAALVVALTLISLRGTTQTETVALSGIAQSLGYLLASAGPVAFGALAEASGSLSASLALLAALALAQCVAAIPAGKVPAR